MLNLQNVVVQAIQVMKNHSEAFDNELHNHYLVFGEKVTVLSHNYVLPKWN
jgi:hypothetical protein